MIFRDFLEDRRLSMEVYADHLASELGRQMPEGWQVDQYTPRIGETIRRLPVSEIVRLRLARYLSYPRQAQRHQGDINHIVDPGYGHLRRVLRPDRTVVTVHDLVPLLRWKGEIPGVARARRPWLSEVSLCGLRQVTLIADSERTKRDMIRHLGCEPDRVHVIHCGVDRRFRPFEKTERWTARKTLGLPNLGIPLVLITSTAFYKNPATSLAVVRRLQELCREPPLLVHLGEPSRDWDAAVRRKGMGGRVIALTHVTNEQMPALYNAVDCLLFPSWYEGFGMPPVEAMACGTPVVASNAGSLPEILGDAAVMLDPDDIEGLAASVRSMIEDAEVRERYIACGLQQAARYSWQRCARQTLQIYQQLQQLGETQDAA